MTTTQQILDERYGRRRSTRSRRIAVIVVVAVAVVVVAAFAWMTWAGAADDVDADATGFELVDAHSVTLSFQFTAPIGSAVACALEAQDEEHGIVGWRVVEFAPSRSHAQAHTESIPTVAAATTGLVNSCWVT